jgi:hypothetical protein
VYSLKPSVRNSGTQRIGIAKGISARDLGSVPSGALQCHPPAAICLPWVVHACAQRGAAAPVEPPPEPGRERRHAARAGAGHAPQDGEGRVAGVPWGEDLGKDGWGAISNA